MTHVLLLVVCEKCCGRGRGVAGMSQTNDPKVRLLSDNTTDTGRRRRHTALVVSIACVVITSVLLAITLAITLSVSPNGDSDSGGQSNCITPDVCNSNILKYIDSSYNPCDDFYHYSCGNWLSANPLNGRSEVDIFNEVAIDNYKHISEYLAKPVQSSDPDAIKKSKYIYAACNNVNYIQAHYVQHLQEFIKNAGGWADIGIFPDKGWDINHDLANHHYNGSSAFFIREIVPDDHNSSKPIILVITSVIIILYAFFNYLYKITFLCTQEYSTHDTSKNQDIIKLWLYF